MPVCMLNHTHSHEIILIMHIQQTEKTLLIACFVFLPFFFSTGILFAMHAHNHITPLPSSTSSSLCVSVCLTLSH